MVIGITPSGQRVAIKREGVKVIQLQTLSNTKLLSYYG